MRGAFLKELSCPLISVAGRVLSLGVSTSEHWLLHTIIYTLSIYIKIMISSHSFSSNKHDTFLCANNDHRDQLVKRNREWCLKASNEL